MDYCCSTLKGNTHLPKLSGFDGGLRNVDQGFLKGGMIRGSLNDSVWVNHLQKSLKFHKRVSKITNPGVAFSVITSDNGKETLTLAAPRFERRRVNPKNVAAIILGGGAGTQLFPLTSKSATPAVPVGGCYRLIDIPMSNCINSTINKIFVLTQFNSASLNRHIARTYFGNGVNFGDGFVEVLAATQTPGEAGMNWFQGTADAVRQFTWVFEDAKNKDIEDILIFRAPDFGLLKFDSKGQVIQFAEKPKGDDLQAMRVDTSLLGLSPKEAEESPYIASMGVYVFKRDILLKLLRWRYPTSNDFGSEILPAAVTEHNMQAYLFRDYWEDIGTIKSFYDANLALTDEVPKFQFYDPKTPFFTSPRFLPPTKIEKSKVKLVLGCQTD
ncbi:ADP-glucose pyrophosphorylase, conserved site-containing protein [Cynara cardunculus var. scolymus]|uniref:ADP-glucose pyrophosphorylase, conserved site-containing protein n=1 Tax=Cynara cardunculus var. scolymus TaxID=59895 RepID=A0A118K143_CYNCS|nr:ADP-glucose pyrophosphorylase, conserved site-containing protein [Cynara cardunculus var. scolymus]